MNQNTLSPGQPDKNHICGIFRDSSRQLLSVSEFVLEGLQNQEKCLLAWPGSWIEQLVNQLDRKAFDVRKKIEAKAIEFFEPREVYLSGGTFCAEKMLSLLERFHKQALSDGFAGVRGVGEMSWAVKAFNVWDELFAYEAQVTELIHHKQFKLYCLYDPALFPAKNLYRAMLTHPHLENEKYAGLSPTYVPPQEFLQQQWKSRFDSADLNRTGKQYIVVEQKSSEPEKTLTDQMLDNIKDSVLLVNSSGGIQYMNRAAQNRYGNQINRICHQSIFRNVNPCPICQVIKLVLQGKEKVETEIQDEQGAHLNLSAYPFSNGECGSSLIIYLRDVTQRKKWEEESAFMDKFSSLGYLASGVAHELNNHLTPIVIYSQMLGQPNLPESVRQKAQKIETCATASKRLVESLTDFSQKIPHKKEFADLNRTIQKTIDLMEYRLSAASIKVMLNLDPSLPGALVDELKIQQVFSNLITNAYQAMQPAGGKIVITSSHSDGWCRFEIADTGPGIPKEIRSKIFDPFFTTREIGEGKGLGLSTSLGIVAAHQGRISFESKENVGTTFVVELPVTAGLEKSLSDGQIQSEALGTAVIS